MPAAADAALGASALAWAIAAPWQHPREPVAWGLALVNAAAGAMFLLRRPASRSGSLADAAVAAASIPLGGIALRLAPIGAWPRAAEALFVAAAAAAAVAILALGRSFGVLPALRAIVQRGPYRLVRHPIYAAELAMVAACALASRRPAALLVAAAAVALVAARILFEERLLAHRSSYRAYRGRVRWRLVPGVW